MQLLPPLVTAGGTVSLPLADASEQRLAAALVCGHRWDSADPQLLLAALKHDPALALWAACSYAAHVTEPPQALAALAAWLAARLLDELQASPDAELADRARTQAIELAEQGTRVAELAGQIAQQSGSDAEAAYLLGLLHAARDWLALNPVAGEAPSRALLPKWLARDLEQLESAGLSADAPSSSIACVARAKETARLQAAEMLRPHPAAAADDHPRYLAHVVRRLIRLRDLEREFQQTLEQEKLEALKEFAYGAGHEINNPLANISARAQTLLQGEQDPERRRTLAAINAQAFRAHEMIADTMLFARPPQPVFETVDLAALLEKVHGELSPQAAQQQTELTLALPPEREPIGADSTQLAVAIRSLCVNALEALVRAGHVSIELRFPAEEPVARIVVTDDGPGIPPAARPHIFEPYYSGREAGRGLGLGLSKCWRIVTLHAGRIDVESPATGGAKFTITLPKSHTR